MAQNVLSDEDLERQAAERNAQLRREHPAYNGGDARYPADPGVGASYDPVHDAHTALGRTSTTRNVGDEAGGESDAAEKAEYDARLHRLGSRIAPGKLTKAEKELLHERGLRVSKGARNVAAERAERARQERLANT
jgi:hypothetical protein